jgi:hypothetical protein
MTIEIGIPEKQRAVLDRWLRSLTKIPEVDVIWLEGSLTDPLRATLGADMDMRFGIADEAFEELWMAERGRLLEGLGEHRSLHCGSFRFLTVEGVVVEVMASKTSELDGKELFDWRILFSRLPDGRPAFKKIPDAAPAQVWPHPEPLTVASVRELTNLFLHWLATASTPFYSKEVQSAQFSLGLLRTELMKLLFRRCGVWFFKRYKHLSEVLPEEFLADLEYVHTRSEATHDLGEIAEETLRTFEMAGKHLSGMSRQVGGGFEPEWYDRLLAQVREDLAPFVKR